MTYIAQKQEMQLWAGSLIAGLGIKDAVQRDPH